MYLSLILFVSLQPLVYGSCCYGFQKVCENIEDVSINGNSDWRSLVIKPEQCEKSSQTMGTEVLSKETFENIPQLTNVYIVEKNVIFEENCFVHLKNNLVYLSVIQNNISKVENNIFSDLPKLKKLVLRDSNIKDISEGSFKNLPKLEVLLLSGNELKEIKNNILNTIHVKTMDLSYNSINKIEINAFPNDLILLNLKKNNIEELPDNTFSNLNSLEMLILSKNKLKSIQKGTFLGLSNLSKLDLSRNEIDNIAPDTFTELQELMFLYLKNNKLRVLNADVFLKDMINLTDLELEQNSLSYLDVNIFNRTPNLEEISLSNNPWQCKCLENIINVLTNNSISMTEKINQQCTVNHDKCIPI